MTRFSALPCCRPRADVSGVAGFVVAAVILTVAAGLTAPLRPAGAAEPAAANSPEARLREALRTTTLQLRAAETDRATLQASKDEADAQLKTLKEQFDVVTQRANDDKQSAEARIADLTKQANAQATELAQYKEALAKWKDGYQKAADLARAKEAERAQFQQKTFELQRKVEDRENKNRELFRIAKEILTRYERFGLGDALSAREPFIGQTRVKLENQVQGYDDQLRAQRIKPN